MYVSFNLPISENIILYSCQDIKTNIFRYNSALSRSPWLIDL